MHQALLPIAINLEALYQEVKNVVSVHRTLVISAIASVTGFILPEVYNDYMLSHPEVNVHFITEHAYESYHHLENNVADMSYVTTLQYSKSAKAIPLYSESMLLACNKGLVLHDPVHPSELDVSQGILHRGDASIKAWQHYWFGASTVAKLQSDNIHQFATIISSNKKWCVFPETICNILKNSDTLNFYSLTDPPQERTVYLLVRKTESISDEIRDWLLSLRKVVEHYGAKWLAEEIL